jgi:hypothetical protein
MSADELDRVRADLATMKSVCMEPAVPLEDTWPSLIAAAFGATIAVAPWFVPMVWVRIGVLAVVIVGLAIYVPWKKRVLHRDSARRQLETRELKIWAVAILGLVSYVLWLRIVKAPSSEVFGMSASAVLFFVGLGSLANGLVHPTRHYYVVGAFILMFGGMLGQFAGTTNGSLSLLGGTAALACLANSLMLLWIARKEPVTHVGH